MNFIKHSILFLFLSGIMVFSVHYNYESPTALSEPQTSTATTAPLDLVQPIPSSKYCYRSGQLSLPQLERLLQSGQIKRVLRLNGGSGRDQGGVSHEEERALCRQYGARFEYLNLDYYDLSTALGQQRLQEAVRMLQQGNTYVHCRHGIHRAGLVVGMFMAQRGHTWEEILAHNRWQELAVRPGRYVRYVEPVYYAVNTNEHE